MAQLAHEVFDVGAGAPIDLGRVFACEQRDLQPVQAALSLGCRFGLPIAANSSSPPGRARCAVRAVLPTGWGGEHSNSTSPPGRARFAVRADLPTWWGGEWALQERFFAFRVEEVQA